MQFCMFTFTFVYKIKDGREPARNMSVLSANGRISCDATVIVLSTLETKRDETDYFVTCLADHGAEAQVLDISLASGGTILDGLGKLDAMEAQVQQTALTLAQDLGRACAVVASAGPRINPQSG